MSMIENLTFIKKNGIEKFIKSQYRKYRCKKCGELISVHNKKCFKCETVTGWRN
jgi:lipopolysaccharide biosynthesis regulator YciM